VTESVSGPLEHAPFIVKGSHLEIPMIQ